MVKEKHFFSVKIHTDTGPIVDDEMTDVNTAEDGDARARRGEASRGRRMESRKRKVGFGKGGRRRGGYAFEAIEATEPLRWKMMI